MRCISNPKLKCICNSLACEREWSTIRIKKPMPHDDKAFKKIRSNNKCK